MCHVFIFVLAAVCGTATAKGNSQQAEFDA
jgi:hypothetical protein